MIRGTIMARRRKKKWIKGAIKKPGALRRSAKKGEITKSGKLNLSKMEARAKRTGNTTLLRRVNLAKTLRSFRRR